MKNKFKCILLVDDNDDDNFIHTRVIRKMDCAEKIVVCYNGLEAMEFLTTPVNGVHPQPDLIFLDINMPGMDGWEFLREYKKLDSNQQADVVMIMLSTSVNPDDHKRASEDPSIHSFLSKPLDSETLERIITDHFPAMREEWQSTQ